MMAFSVTMAWVRALTAVSRATLSWRIISTVPVPDFGRAVAWPAEHGAGGALGVERVALAVLVPQLPVGTVDLEDGMAARLQEARQAGAVGTGALDAEGADRVRRTRPRPPDAR